MVLSRSRRRPAPDRLAPEARSDGTRAEGTAAGRNAAPGDGRPRLSAEASAFLVCSLIACVAGVVNALSVQTEAMRRGEVAGLAPWLWEGTSAVVVIALLPVLFALIRRWPLLGPGWRRSLAVHALATVPYSLAHVAGMVLLRTLLAPSLLGHRYRFFGDPVTELLYEYRKDAVGYLILAYVMTAVLRGSEARRDPEAPPPRPATKVALRCGATTVLVEPLDVAWARAAGNYVEVSTGGPPILVRSTLAALAKTLEGAGQPMLRVHRSWLVPSYAVTALHPDGNGGLRAVLTDGQDVPVGRGYREAIEKQLGVSA